MRNKKLKVYMAIPFNMCLDDPVVKNQKRRNKRKE